MSFAIRCVLALLCAFSLVGLALAQAAKKQAAPYRELFQELDVNRDRAIERDEVPPAGRAAFDRLLKRGDDNHNGKLEAQEYRALMLDLREFGEQASKKAVDRFHAMDKNHDGKVSREEFTGPKPRFDVLDRDGDGQVTDQEFLNAVTGKAQPKKTAGTAEKKPVAAAKKPAAAAESKPAPKDEPIKKSG
ncbi:MAG: EF-hand domain-containing protein [Isosphaeraceae bacterium]